MVQLEVDQLPQLAKLGWESLETVVTQVQDLERAAQAGEAQGLAEDLQVVIVGGPAQPGSPGPRWWLAAS